MADHQAGRRLINYLTGEIVNWFGSSDTSHSIAEVNTWTPKTWEMVKRVIFAHGVGPQLYDQFIATGLFAAFPEPLRDWLAGQMVANGERIKRMHAELEEILLAANRLGIPVMPMKGSLLTLKYYSKPALRPMADLDLLIHGQDLAGFREILKELGYRKEPHKGRHDRVHSYLPENSRVVSLEGEHPDNPRPVEVHTEIEKFLWVDRGGYDLTEYLWTESREVAILGSRGWIPSTDRFLVYLSVHATYHHLFLTGRLIHLLDLALLAPKTRALNPPDSNWVYPSINLAARWLPNQFSHINIEWLSSKSHKNMRQWADHVVLDGRCGLITNLNPPKTSSRWLRRWIRWQPTPQRLVLAYGKGPLIWGYLRHFFQILRYGIISRNRKPF